jgi:hypothetical protein
VYDGKGDDPALWRSHIVAFNENNMHNPINIIYSYGGSMEVWSPTSEILWFCTDVCIQYYPKSADPFKTYFPEPNKRAGRVYIGMLLYAHRHL